MLNKNKKAAVELSIGTIVIIVLAMSMLILGLVLIRGIFRGATSNVDEINEKVREEIKNLFVDDDERAVLRLTESTAEVEQGSEFGVAFGVRNTDRGSVMSQEYRYTIELDDIEVRQHCGVDEATATRWVRFGSGTLSARPGELDSALIKVSIPEGAPLCETKFRILIYKGRTGTDLYEDLSFFVKIVPKGFF